MKLRSRYVELARSGNQACCNYLTHSLTFNSSHAKSVGHVFAYLYTLDDDSERPMDYETSLLPKVYPVMA